MNTKKTDPSDETQKEPKENKQRLTKTLAVIGIVIIIILLLLRSCQGGNPGDGSGNANEPFTISTDANAGDGSAGKSEDEIIAELNEKIKQSEINMSMNANPVFENGTAAGNLLIKNSEVNNYPQMVEIYLKDGTLVYKSGLIPIGKVIETAPLTKDLDAGTYPAVAHFYNILTEDGSAAGETQAQIAGEARVEIQLVVQN